MNPTRRNESRHKLPLSRNEIKTWDQLNLAQSMRLFVWHAASQGNSFLLPSFTMAATCQGGGPSDPHSTMEQLQRPFVSGQSLSTATLLLQCGPKDQHWPFPAENVPARSTHCKAREAVEEEEWEEHEEVREPQRELARV